MVIAPTAGHLFTLYTEERGFPVFNYLWGPRWIHDPNSKHLRKFYNMLKKLSKHAEAYINACDYDIEGSVIGYNIIRHFGDIKRAYRVKFSTLTREEILRAFNNPQLLDWGNIESGLARHELDWLWGINASRVLMEIYGRISGNRIVLSAGRVQTPTLLELVRRYLERGVFVPEVRFTVSVRISYSGREYKLEADFEPYERLDEAAKLVRELRDGGHLVVERVDKRSLHLEPPPPFNLTELQLEAARVFGYSPAKTLEIAEDLYLDSLISYPRTNSEKIPATIDNTSILRKLTSLPGLGDYASELLQRKLLTPREGTGEDPAHPAIHPTGYIPTRRLSKEEFNILELVVRRYLASFYPAARVDESIYIFKEPRTGAKFKLLGRRVVSKEWLRVYHYRRITDVETPVLRSGERIEVSSARLLKVYTRPPPPYTKASILKWMESSGIGTEATRAEIIETLFRRKYVQGRSIEVTDLGLKVAHILSTLLKEITEVELTREFEKKLQAIMVGKVSRDEVVKDAISRLGSKLKEVKEMLEKYEGSELRERLGLSIGGQKCAVCGNEAVMKVEGLFLCSQHSEAYQNMVRMHEIWQRSMGMSFTEYVMTLSKLRSTGKFVKELVEYLKKRVR